MRATVDYQTMSNRNSNEPLLFFAAGVFVTIVVNKIIAMQKSSSIKRETAGATVEGDDLSLFYGDKKLLTKISQSRKYLPAEFYGTMVKDCIVCCCDIVLVRYNHQLQKKECLLVERASEPAKGLWWWPGGRILKGETFFDAAKRKAIQETGIKDVDPLQVLGVWNTFFPTSHWDTEAEKGTQTVNCVVLVEISQLPGATSNVTLDNQSERYKWVGLDPDAALQNGEDPYVWKILQRLKTWDPTYTS